MTATDASPRLSQVIPERGMKIIERHKQADPRTILEVHGDYIVAKGFVRTKISRKNFSRYYVLSAPSWNRIR